MEKELAEKIKEIRSQIKDRLIVRNLSDDDWEVLLSWWDFWPGWKAPVKEFLPEDGKGGLMIEKNGIPIVAGFMYQTNSDVVIFEWVISNPKYKEDDRQEAIELLIKEAERTSRDWGYKQMFTVGRNKSLIDIHERLGWKIDNKQSYEITKNL